MSETLGGLQVAAVAADEPRAQQLLAAPHITVGTTKLTPYAPIALRCYEVSPLAAICDVQISVTVDQAEWLAKALTLAAEVEGRA